MLIYLAVPLEILESTKRISFPDGRTNCIYLPTYLKAFPIVYTLHLNVSVSKDVLVCVYVIELLCILCDVIEVRVSVFCPPFKWCFANAI